MNALIKDGRLERIVDGHLTYDLSDKGNVRVGDAGGDYVCTLPMHILKLLLHMGEPVRIVPENGES